MKFVQGVANFFFAQLSLLIEYIEIHPILSIKKLEKCLVFEIFSIKNLTDLDTFLYMFNLQTGTFLSVLL